MAAGGGRYVNEPGECNHAGITPEGQCVLCGVQFVFAWRESTASLFALLLRNMAGVLVFLALFGVTRGPEDGGTLEAILLAAAVFFIARALLSGLDLLSPHSFFQGALGELKPRPAYHVLAIKSNMVQIGTLRFPMSPATYERLQPGQTLLVEALRFSRMPVALYRIDP